MNTLQEQRQHYAAVRQRIMAASWYRDPPTERIDLLAKVAPPPAPPKPSYFYRTIYIEPIGPGLTVLPPQTAGKTTKQIIREVVEKHGIRVWELKSGRRAHEVVLARQEACYRLRVERKMSLPEIGRRLGGRDHTTVLHGCRQHAKRNALPDVVKP